MGRTAKPKPQIIRDPAKRFKITCSRKIKDQMKETPGVIVMEALKWDEEVDRWECWIEINGNVPPFIQGLINVASEAR